MQGMKLPANLGGVVAALALSAMGGAALAWESDYTAEKCVLKQHSRENPDDFVEFRIIPSPAHDHGMIVMIVKDSSLRLDGIERGKRFDDKGFAMVWGDSVFDMNVMAAIVARPDKIMTLTKWERVRGAGMSAKNGVRIEFDGRMIATYDFSDGPEQFRHFEECLSEL